MLRKYLNLVCLSAITFCTDGNAQNTNEFEKITGFKNIRLTTPLDSIAGEKKLEKKVKYEDVVIEVYRIEHSDYKYIGEVPVLDLELRAYNHLIFEIHVITEKDSRLMKALENLYGSASFDGIKSTYYWKQQDLILKFSTHSKNKLLLIYSSYTILNKMRADKTRKVDNIADDL